VACNTQLTTIDEPNKQYKTKIEWLIVKQYYLLPRVQHPKGMGCRCSVPYKNQRHSNTSTNNDHVSTGHELLAQIWKHGMPTHRLNHKIATVVSASSCLAFAPPPPEFLGSYSPKEASTRAGRGRGISDVEAVLLGEGEALHVPPILRFRVNAGGDSVI
jgi:hypothetical protein